MRRNLSSFPQRKYSVPAPQVALKQLNAFSWPDDVYWNGPRSGGIYEVSNALVDRENRIGVWSQPTIIDVKSGWMLWGAAWNQPQSYEAIACVWKAKCIKLNSSRQNNMLSPGQESVWCVSKHGTGPASIQSDVPWGRLTPRYERLNNGMTHYQLERLQTGGVHQTIASPPPVIYSSLRNALCDIVFCWLTQKGESAFSPLCTVDKIGDGQTIERNLIIVGQAIPPGVIGYRIYVRYHDETIWQRAAHGDETTYQIDNYMPIISRVTGERPEQGNGMVILDQLNTALLDWDGDIDIDVNDVVITSPIIDHYDPAKFGRRIGTPNGGEWSMRPVLQAINNYPALLIHNQRSHWEGLRIESENVPLSAGIAFADYSGGQGFGNRFTNCRIVLDHTGGSGRNQGIRVLEECAGGGHSASELLFQECQIAATNPIWLEYKQTCNVRFRDTLASCFATPDIRNSVVWAAMPNEVKFDSLFCDCPSGTIFSTEQARITCDFIFVDRGCISLVDFNDYHSGMVTIHGGAVNFFTYPHDGRIATPSLARAGNTKGAILRVEGLKAGDAKVFASQLAELNLAYTGGLAVFGSIDVSAADPL